jgi:hypothetical protein
MGLPYHRPMLDKIGRVIAVHGESIKTALIIVGTLSGWLFHGWRKWQERQPRMTLESKGTSAFIVNHGTEALELLQNSLILRDALDRPELAKTYNFIVAAAGSVRPGERAEVFRSDAAIEQAVAEISEPLRKQMAEYGAAPPNHAHMDFILFYSAVGDRKTRKARFQRWLYVFPGSLSIDYGPYHHRSSRLARIMASGRSAFRAARNPRRFVEQRRKFRNLQDHLDVLGIARALSQGVITTDQAERRLRRIANRVGEAPDELVTHHLQMAKDSHDASVAMLEKERATPSAPDSARPQAQPPSENHS